MSAMQPRDNLTMKAAALAKQSPELWAEFLQAVAAVSDTHRENLIKSPLDMLPVMQGRAQMATDFSNALAMAVINADKIGKSNVK